MLMIELRATRKKTMPFLIDGHNLIPHIRGLSLSQLDDELALIDLLNRYFKKERRNATIFFDRAAPGGGQEIRRGFVTAHFTRSPLNADQAIRNAVRGLGRSAANYTVITSDNEVADNAQRSGARVLSSAEFAQKLTVHEKSGKSGEKEQAEDVDYWLRMFKGKS